MSKAHSILGVAAAVCCALTGCATMDMGSGAAKTEATGSAGGADSQGANSKLPHCESPLGTIAVVEDTTTPWYAILAGQYHLGPTTPVLKLLIQQSNCFVVVDRGRAMNTMMEERQLEQSGELRNGSNFGGGQMVAADYSLTPSITFSNNNAGGAGALVGGLLGPVGAIVGGSLHSKEASTLLTLVDDRSGVQLAAAEGSAKSWDIGGVGGLLGVGGGGLAGGYSNTAEGKVIVAAFLDSYVGIVNAVRHYKAQTVSGGLGTGGGLAVQGAGDNAIPRDGHDVAATAAAAPMTLAQAQARLDSLGYGVGTPDGVMGRRTRSQLRAFQKARGIPMTGTLDPATVRELSK